MEPDLSDKLPYQDLTYKIIGALFKVHNMLGNSLEERYYQRALEKEFISLNIKFKREFPVDVLYENTLIGKHLLDFIIEDKIILELKTIPKITNKALIQTVSYLKSTGLKIALLANFRTEKLTYRRLINPLLNQSAKSVPIR